jgi:cytochrome c oxidase subunit 4
MADHHPAAVHIVPVWIYLLVFASLAALTGLTVGVSFLDLGRLSTVVALGIATVKATLVVLYFMHVRYSTRLIPLAVVAGIFWLLILFVLTLSDYETRGWLGVPGK